MSQLYDIDVTDINGKIQSLSQFAGRVWLVVNTASRCGFTPQYAELESLYQDYHRHGLVVLAFPCNQFGQQEPGDAEEIRQFCSTTYPISFPLFAKIEVNGPNTSPLFQQLKSACPGVFGSQSIKWNFTKFLVDARGIPVARFAPQTRPEQLKSQLLPLLNLS